MFGKKKADDIRAFLGKGSSFQGNLTFHGSIRIDGNVSGNITGDGLLVIGEGARIEATSMPLRSGSAEPFWDPSRRMSQST